MQDYLSQRSSKSYAAAVFAKPEDAVQHGVKGQRWGVRRSKAQLKAAAKAGPDDAKSEPKKTDGPEPSAARYARIAAQARKGGAKDLSDDDLRFFNARTEALKKVAALNQQKPGWLKETTTKVLQDAAKKAMTDIANANVEKYVTKPMVSRIAAAGTRP